MDYRPMSPTSKPSQTEWHDRPTYDPGPDFVTMADEAPLTVWEIIVAAGMFIVATSFLLACSLGGLYALAATIAWSAGA